MKKLFIIAIMAAACLTSQAAPQDKMRHGGAPHQAQTVETKVARMQQHLMLDDKTADKFADIYTDYLKALDKLQPKQMKPADGKPGEAPKKLSDGELKKMHRERLNNEKKRAELTSEYYDKLSSILSARQLHYVFFSQHHNAKGHGHGVMPQVMRGRNGQPKGPGEGQPGQPTVCPEQGQPLETR